jgi:hypothetical protein
MNYNHFFYNYFLHRVLSHHYNFRSNYYYYYYYYYFYNEIQFHHYNLLRTKRLLTSVEYRRLAAAHPNFIAVKNSTSDPAILADLLSLTPRLRFYITEMGYAIARRTHDVGFLISLASVNPARAKAFVAGDDARRAADVADFSVMGAKLRELSAGRYHIDGAYDKMLFRVSDPTFPLRLLPPYTGASEEDFARFVAALPAGWGPQPPATP